MNLLIVDDEPAARVGLKRLCERSRDMRVVGEAGTGARAIEAVESLRPDLMLLDADLPDMSGFEVLRALGRRQQRRTILVTADAHDAPGALAAGALDYLVKPVNEEAFSASIVRARVRAAPRLPGAARATPGGRCSSSASASIGSTRSTPSGSTMSGPRATTSPITWVESSTSPANPSSGSIRC